MSRSGFYGKTVALVVTEKGPPGRSFYVRGNDLTMHKEVVYRGNDVLYIYVNENLAVNDTLIKRTGTAAFLIKKRRIDVVVEYTCQEDSVQSGVVHDVIQVDTLYQKTGSIRAVITSGLR